MNNNFNFQQKYITNSNFRYTVIPFSREQQGPLLSLVYFINNNPYEQKIICIFMQHVRNSFFRWVSMGNFLENIFLRCGLNSFQQLAISIPFSRFIRLFGDMLDPGLMQSIKSASLICHFLQSVNKIRFKKCCSLI